MNGTGNDHKHGERRARLDADDSRLSERDGRRKWFLLLLIALVGAFGIWQFGSEISLVQLAERESQLREFRAASPVLAIIIATLFYVYVTGSSIPGALPLTIFYGWYFGFWSGLCIVSFASTAGATLAFLLSRHFFRETVQRRFADTSSRIERSLREDGAFYLFTLRLVPAFPFFMINLVMGLTPMRIWTYWWVSQLGMLPATLVYVYVGSSVPSVRVLSQEGLGYVFSDSRFAQLTVAFILLGTFPLATRWIVRWIRRRKSVGTVADR